MNSTLKWITFWAACGLVLLLPVTMASAQDRSETGRHQPKPPVEKEEEAATRDLEEFRAPRPRRWYLGASGGVLGGSDLFRVKVLNGVGVPWDPDTGGGFQSSRFTAALDRNVSLGLFLARDLGDTWSVRADFGYSRMDVAAEALVGQTGAVFLFDRMSVVTLGIGAEARLTRASSYPYAQVSVLLNHLGPVRAEKLAQTNVGARLGLGYLHNLERVWGLRFEARLGATGFSVGDYVPQSTLPDQPVIEFETEDHLVFFEFLIGIQARI
ncbi:MAG: hypothetical protein ABFS42_00755 [Candidatus Krumholzibacteriota bacterium]